MYRSDALENAIAIVHTVGNKSVDYHSRVVVRQCMRAESSTVDADGENIVPLYSLHMERECQLGINVNAEAHDTG